MLFGNPKDRVSHREAHMILTSDFKWFFVYFDLILYLPINNFSVMLGQVFLRWTSTKQRLICLAQRHNAVTPVRLATPRSPVKHSTTVSHCALIASDFIIDKDLLHERKNSVDPDQLASLEASWPASTLFLKKAKKNWISNIMCTLSLLCHMALDESKRLSQITWVEVQSF